ncbi:MAG: DUF1573 domain-containing protein [Bacteroidetes bacterium]|nr:DUF1573 domain-containing protein [Bacteroidota bacterium]
MKQINLSLATIVFFLLLSCNNNATSDKDNKVTTDIVNNPITASGKYDKNILPKIKFDKATHDFGVIIQGEKVSHSFTYKNVGGSDLLIRDIKATCGCTVVKFSKDPLPPGKEGKVEVVFNSDRRKGIQRKSVFLWANTQPNRNEISITAEVIVPK